MTLRQYLATMIFATLLCYTAWFFVIDNVDPFAASAAGLGFFYLSFFLSLLGTCSLIFFCLYRFFGTSDLPLFRYVQKSFRESLAISAYLALMLLLQGASYLTFWIGSLVTGLFILVISFMVSLRSHPAEPESI
ncbi:MAG: hypothetical protein UY92_C0006G0068 [Candidatus Magasanikbacteria bacterium GW2011_GWA2_56_11]|uniref:Uncharacterized protein n=1 Tax=Candidatus Magasanikbacteria bacterium GW2011_GWA2_56_11 TaxID=1619044 RepID=A0A0G2AMG2_9BACT|nr:MAG: hypothetical protein UY92_C0006G0068 [Candidatus Magasanikbacteria bacterium GW2011_GWA2_56_11]